jgi:hypothetical protein
MLANASAHQPLGWQFSCQYGDRAAGACANPLGEQELLEGLKQLPDGEQKAKVGASARGSTILDWAVSLVMIVLLNMLASTFACFTQLPSPLVPVS